METLSHNDLLALNRAIGEIYAARDLESFYRSVFSSIQGIIPGELCSCADITLHPARFLNMQTRTEDHSLVSGKLLPALNAHLHEHPLSPHCFSGQVVKTTDYVSNSQFKDTAIHNEYYRHLDVDTQISFSIPLTPEKLSLFALSRKSPDFSERDRLILTLLRPHLINALRNATEFGGMRIERDLLQKGAEAERLGSVLVQADGMMLCISPFAKDMLYKYFDAILVEGDTLPDRLLNWFNANAVTLGGFSKRVDREPLTVEMGEVRVRIKLLHDITTGDSILIIIEMDTSLALQSLQKYGLSCRETEVLSWLAAGKTNVEIAIILGMSKRTAEKHLEKIFTKLGVTTRVAAAAIMREKHS